MSIFYFFLKLQFIALDSDEAVPVLPGEIQYASGNTVVTRHINWRQSKEGLIHESSTNVCFMAEILYGYPEASFADMKDDFRKLCIDLINVEPELFLLNSDSPSIIY